MMKKILLLVVVLSLNIAMFANDYSTAEYRKKYGNSKDKAAQEKKELGTMIITSNILETNITTEPSSIEIITEEDIKKSGAKNLISILDTVASVKSSYGFGRGKVDIRGQGETSISNILIFIDGVRLNTIDMNGANLNAIPIDNVSHIEITSGGNGVLYGDGAVGGVINIYTKTFQTDKKYKNVKLEYGNDDYLNFGGIYSEKFDKYSMSISYFQENTDGYRKNSDLKNKNFNIGLNYFDDVNSTYNVKLKFNKIKSDFGLPGSLTKAEVNSNRKHSNTPDDRSFNDEQNYTISYEQLLDSNLKVVVDYNIREIEANSRYYGSDNKADTRQNGLGIKSIYYYLENQSQTTIGYNLNTGKSDVDGWSKYTVKKESNGFFIHNKYSKDNFITTQGYRHEKIKFKESLDKEYTVNVYDLSLNHLYSKTGNAYFKINTGFRVPNTDELGFALAEFKAQEHIDYEIGVRDYQFKTFYNISVFLTDTKNEIYYDDQKMVNTNIDGKTRRYGSDITLKQVVSKFNFTESATYIKAKIKDGDYKGNYLPGVSKYSLKLAVNYNITEEISLNGAYRYNGDYYASADFNNKAGKEPGYGIFDMRLNYEKQNFLVYIGADNLFGKKHYDFVGYLDYNDSKYYYPAAEQIYYIGAGYKF